MFFKKATSPKQISKRDRTINRIKLYLLLILMFLLLLYLVLKIIYTGGRFTITLDKAGDAASNLVIYDNPDDKTYKRVLYADNLEFITNISVNWLPENINNEAVGSHNGDNYIAYTFFIENVGPSTVHYWYEIPIDDVIKNIDEAVRVMLFVNDEKTIYAKANPATGGAENGTVTFYSENSVCLKKRSNFKSGDKDKITIVMWIEGDDPQCLDDLIGGEIKMHMDISEEYILQ